MTVHSILPKIEGFQPIPNAVMIPFMETQSAALAYAFGLNYEYGKRKIKSMDNETFNSLTPEQIANMANTHTSILLKEFTAQVPKVMPAQAAIFTQYVEIEKQKVIQNIALAKWLALNFPQIASGEDPTGGGTIRDEPLPEIGEGSVPPGEIYIIGRVCFDKTCTLTWSDQSVTTIPNPDYTPPIDTKSTSDLEHETLLKQKWSLVNEMQRQLKLSQERWTAARNAWAGNSAEGQKVQQAIMDKEIKLQEYYNAQISQLTIEIGNLQNYHNNTYGHYVGLT